MNKTNINSNKGKKFSKIFHEDMKNIKFRKDMKREFRELREFYITEEQNKRLAGMNPPRRGFHIIILMIKSLFRHLTPTRRLLTAIGLFIVLFGTSVIFDQGNIQINNSGLIGGIIIFIVLMLELKDKLLAKDELEAGRKVQHALTPERSPKVEGWSIWLFTRPANEVGGDLVDYLKINDHRIGFILADVAGKGLHAALLMAKLQATIRALAADFDSLSKFVTKINSIFCRDSLPGIFASMIYIEIRPDDQVLGFVNAGHFPPILIKNGKITETNKKNTAIGLTKHFDYNEDEILMGKGEILIAYTDGVTEARNEFGLFFEKERLLKILPSLSQKNLDDAGETIVNEVDRFVGDAPVNDDLSLMIIRKD